MGAPNEFTAADIKASSERSARSSQRVGEKALFEAKKVGDMYAADKPKVDEMLVKVGELNARLLDVEQKAARAGEDQKKTDLSAGQMLVQSEDFQAFAKTGMKSQKASYVFELPQAAIISTGTSNTTTVGVRPDYVRPACSLAQNVASRFVTCSRPDRLNRIWFST
jgi:hypothetical protein